MRMDKGKYSIPSDNDHYKPRDLPGSFSSFSLAGVQIAFTTSMGKPTNVGNSQIEAGFVGKSSCMTCHARASVGTDTMLCGRTGCGTLGVPDTTWFYRGGKQFRFQTDFVWSLVTMTDPKNPILLVP